MNQRQITSYGHDTSFDEISHTSCYRSEKLRYLRGKALVSYSQTGSRHRESPLEAPMEIAIRRIVHPTICEPQCNAPLEPIALPSPSGTDLPQPA